MLLELTACVQHGIFTRFFRHGKRDAAQVSVGLELFEILEATAYAENVILFTKFAPDGKRSAANIAVGLDLLGMWELSATAEESFLRSSPRRASGMLTSFPVDMEC